MAAPKSSEADELPLGEDVATQNALVRPRSEPRFETALSGRLRLPASEHDCQLADLSAGGMNIVAHDVLVTVGLQVAFLAQKVPHLVGIVRWISGSSFGVQFTTPISSDVIRKIVELKRRVRVPRAARVKTELPAIVFFDGIQHRVAVRNIAVGGLMMTTLRLVRRGQRKPIRDGQALMIQVNDLMPIGGHVSWTCGSQYGLMFSKLLRRAMAEEIIKMGRLSSAWLDDVHLTYLDIGNS